MLTTIREKEKTTNHKPADQKNNLEAYLSQNKMEMKREDNRGDLLKKMLGLGVLFHWLNSNIT